MLIIISIILAILCLITRSTENFPKRVKLVQGKTKKKKGISTMYTQKNAPGIPADFIIPYDDYFTGAEPNTMIKHKRSERYISLE